MEEYYTYSSDPEYLFQYKLCYTDGYTYQSETNEQAALTTNCGSFDCYTGMGSGNRNYMEQWGSTADMTETVYTYSLSVYNEGGQTYTVNGIDGGGRQTGGGTTRYSNSVSEKTVIGPEGSSYTRVGNGDYFYHESYDASRDGIDTEIRHFDTTEGGPNSSSTEGAETDTTKVTYKMIKSTTTEESRVTKTTLTSSDYIVYSSSINSEGTTTYVEIYATESETRITSSIVTTSNITRTFLAEDENSSTTSNRAIYFADTICMLENEEIGYYADEFGSQEGYFTAIAKSFTGTITITFNPDWRVSSLYTNTISKAYTTGSDIPTDSLESRTITIPSYGITIDTPDYSRGQTFSPKTAKQNLIGQNVTIPTTGTIYIGAYSTLEITQKEQTRIVNFFSPVETTSSYFLPTTINTMVTTTFADNALKIEGGYIINPMSRTTMVRTSTRTTSSYNDFSEGGPIINWLLNGKNFTRTGKSALHAWSIVIPFISSQYYDRDLTVITPKNVQGFLGVSTAGQLNDVYRNVEGTIGNKLPQRKYAIQDLLSRAVKQNLSVLLSPSSGDTFNFYPQYESGASNYNNYYYNIEGSIISTRIDGCTIRVSCTTGNNSSDSVTDNVQILFNQKIGRLENSGVLLGNTRLNYSGVLYGGMQEISEKELTVIRPTGWVEILKEGGRNILTHITNPNGETTIIPTDQIIGERAIYYATQSSTTNYYGNVGGNQIQAGIRIFVFPRFYTALN